MMANAIVNLDLTSQVGEDFAGLLHSVVKTGNNSERCLAVQTLGMITSPVAISALTEALHDEDPDVRCDAAQGLANLNALPACSRLIDNLREDPDAEAKTAYIRALQSLRARECEELLQILAVGRNETRGIAWDGEYSDWDDWLDVQLAAVEALGVIGGDGSAAIIVTALNDPEGQDLWPVACKALAQLGQAGIDQLAALVPVASPLNRKRIAAALSIAGSDADHHLLQKLAQDPDARVRMAAMESASFIPSAEVLKMGLDDTAAEVRAIAVSGMGLSGADHLHKALNDISQAVRIAACNTIAGTKIPIAGLGLVAKIERSLRTSPPEMIAAMVSAAAACEPIDAALLIEDVSNHKSTSPEVRCACLKTVAKLNIPDVVNLLSVASKADKQSIRLNAIAALAEIAKGDDRKAELSAKLLADIIAGTHIPVPETEESDTDSNVIQFIPKKGSQAAGDEGDTAVKLDRDGNDLPPDSATAEVEVEPDEEEPAPMSTLQAIMAVNPEQMKADRTIELDDADLAFLEMTGSLVRRRKLDPDARPAAHIDVRRLAAGMAGDVGKALLVPSLAGAANAQDSLLSEAALGSLARLAVGGTDMQQAEEILVTLAQAGEIKRCCQAISALSAATSAKSEAILRQQLSHSNARVRASALTALVAAGFINDEELAAACKDSDPSVRLAAVKAVADSSSTLLVPALLAHAQMDGGRHKHEAAQLLAADLAEALVPLMDWVAGEDSHKRNLALEMLPALLHASTQQP